MEKAQKETKNEYFLQNKFNKNVTQLCKSFLLRLIKIIFLGKNKD